MITIDGKELRNLEEQVLKNKQDIARHYQATQLPVNLAGITVIGSIDDPSELEGVVGENFGDAYVQVVNDDTKLWIWTRSNPDAGEDDDYWLDIPFTTIGEQGPPGEQGPRGEKGERGSRWFFYNSVPSSTTGFLEGDVVFIPNEGNIYHLHSVGGQLTWLREGSIVGKQGPVGPQGARGLQGERGPVGPQGPQGNPAQNIVILGTVSTIDQLPDPDTVDRNSAYLVGTSAPYSLYIITGTNSLSWAAVGPFNNGTVVSVDGSPVYNWDADTKLDKPTNYTYKKCGYFYYPLLEVQSSGAAVYKWYPGITKANDGTYPTTNDWRGPINQKGAPAVRDGQGEILLPPQTGALNDNYAANHRWVVNNFQPLQNVVILEGELTFDEPVIMYEGYVGYPYGTSEATEITENKPTYVVLRFNSAAMKISRQGYNYPNFYEFVDSGIYVELLRGLTIMVENSVTGDVDEYPVLHFGYEDTYADFEAFFITYLNTQNRTPYTLCYKFYSEDEGTSFQELAQEQVGSEYLIQTTNDY